MNRARLEISPGVMLDARRALFLAEESVLAVADLHLAYALGHRKRGQLLPLSVPDDTSERLKILLDEYRPRTLAVLGDIVHDTVPVREFRDALREFVVSMRERVELRLIAGNHDRDLEPVIGERLMRDLQIGPHRLLHGDGFSEKSAAVLLDQVRTGRGRLIIGHEHPAIGISDRVAHYARVPCFLVCETLVVLPAFSNWAAGCDVRRGEFLSPFPELDSPKKAVAILAGKLLPFPMR